MVRLRSPAIDPAAVKAHVGYDDYPAPFHGPCREREWRQLGDEVGLTQFGVNLTTLPPGAWSSQRHWHTCEDEFVYVLEGELVLITDDGEQLLTPGMAAGFPAGNRDGHHLVNRSTQPARFIEIGTRAEAEEGEYSDIDMKFAYGEGYLHFLHKNGDPY
jgi:uncharacterized cupin superfamily protein